MVIAECTGYYESIQEKMETPILNTLLIVFAYLVDDQIS